MRCEAPGAWVSQHHPVTDSSHGLVFKTMGFDVANPGLVLTRTPDRQLCGSLLTPGRSGHPTRPRHDHITTCKGGLCCQSMWAERKTKWSG